MARLLNLFLSHVASAELQDEVADFVDGKQTLLLTTVAEEILTPNVNHISPLLGEAKQFACIMSEHCLPEVRVVASQSLRL